MCRTFEFVKEHIRYKRNEAIGAARVLEAGVGKCMDYSDLFVALLRANGIPARSVFGYVAFTAHDNPLHAWPEVYLCRQGWVRFDPTAGHSEIVPDGLNYKMRIANKYVTLWEGRNDPEMRASFLSFRWNGNAGSKVSVRVSFDDKLL